MRFSGGGAIVAAAVLSGCAAQQQSAGIAEPDYPIDYQQQIIRNKANLFKDPDSIRDAAIASPTPSMMGWQVCMQANAKNSFGGYTGRQTFIVQIYRNGAATHFTSDNDLRFVLWIRSFPRNRGGLRSAEASDRAAATQKTYLASPIEKTRLFRAKLAQRVLSWRLILKQSATVSSRYRSRVRCRLLSLNGISPAGMKIMARLSKLANCAVSKICAITSKSKISIRTRRCWSARIAS